MAMYSLPFYATPERLPAPLPSLEAITTSPDVVQEYTGRRIVRVDQHFMVKYGLGVDLIEGENMLFVEQSTSIPLPRVYAIYKDKSTGFNCIVMENIDGQTLGSLWSTFATAEKTAISSKLRDMISQLRNIPSPGYFGSLGNLALQDSIFWTKEPMPEINGPFETEAQLNKAMALKYLYNNLPPKKAEFYRRILPRVLQNHDPMFTHGDVQPKNIMVRNDGSLVIIDWETSGWYPSYWEYTLAMFACWRWDDDWHVWVAQIFDEYPNEYAWMDMLRRELWS